MGVVSELAALEEELDRLTTQLLLELRMSKLVNTMVMLELLEVTDRFGKILADEDQVPRRLVGKLWFIFAAMLTEADHARAPEPILEAAWEYHERLQAIFESDLD
jgi:hypothetical protein